MVIETCSCSQGKTATVSAARLLLCLILPFSNLLFSLNAKIDGLLLQRIYFLHWFKIYIVHRSFFHGRWNRPLFLNAQRQVMS